MTQDKDVDGLSSNNNYNELYDHYEDLLAVVKRQ